MPAFRNVALILMLSIWPMPSLAAKDAAQGAMEQDPGKRFAFDLGKAETQFDSARAAYDKGDIEKGDAALEEMTKSLDACLGSLEVAHKARFYKKAELKVALLQRRMKGLLDDIEVQRRGWAEQTDRKLDEIHDKLLAGAMGK